MESKGSVKNTDRGFTEGRMTERTENKNIDRKIEIHIYVLMTSAFSDGEELSAEKHLLIQLAN